MLLRIFSTALLLSLAPAAASGICLKNFSTYTDTHTHTERERERERERDRERQTYTDRHTAQYLE